MIKAAIRKLFNNFDYDITTLYYKGTDKYKVKSDVVNLDLYDTPTGKYYLPSFLKKDLVANTIQRGLSYDDEIIGLAREYITAGSAVLDIGANYGQMSVLLSKFMAGKGDGQLYAFEAEPFVGDVLQRNIAINGCSNVVIVMGAVHKIAGEQLVFPEPDFKRFDSYGSYGIDPNAAVGRTVETITIDDLDIQGAISFIKVDIQGSDLFALQGARKTIMKNKPVIIFEFEEQFQQEFKTSFNDYVEFVRSIGYKFVKVISEVNYVIAPDE